VLGLLVFFFLLTRVFVGWGGSSNALISYFDGFICVFSCWIKN
jgi:hypothetical protein